MWHTSRGYATQTHILSIRDAAQQTVAIACILAVLLHPLTTFQSKKHITIWLFNIAMENPLYMVVLMGTSSVNGPFSMAMFNNQRVHDRLMTVELVVS